MNPYEFRIAHFFVVSQRFLPFLHHYRIGEKRPPRTVGSFIPKNVHQDILNAVGLDFTIYTKKKRDPEFREKILRAYGYSCAVCGFNVRLAVALVGVEAAHIKWHQAGGPDTEENGIALCSMHHKLFDRGVFTLTPERKMVVSQDAHGTHGFEEWLMRFNGRVVQEPIQPYYYPDHLFLDWHAREVFKGPQSGFKCM
jgi:putative restriction endonuclease